MTNRKALLRLHDKVFRYDRFIIVFRAISLNMININHWGIFSSHNSGHKPGTLPHWSEIALRSIKCTCAYMYFMMRLVVSSGAILRCSTEKLCQRQPSCFLWCHYFPHRPRPIEIQRLWKQFDVRAPKMSKRHYHFGITIQCQVGWNCCV